MNTIMFLDIRRSGGTWIFDDAARGVVAEPFVSGIPAMIDHMVEQALGLRIDEARIYFSETPFPGHMHVWKWLSEEWGGNWYKDILTDRVGWLCPCMYKFFAEAPEYIYLGIVSVIASCCVRTAIKTCIALTD